MKIYVNVKPGAKKVEVRKFEGNYFEISIKEPPIQGKANIGVINALSEYFKIPKNRIILLKGFSSRTKVLEVIN